MKKREIAYIFLCYPSTMAVQPESKTFESEGYLSYHERTRAWTIIRFKREVTKVFPTLKDRQSKMKYKFRVFFSLKAFEEFADKVLKKEIDVPAVMYFEREDEEKSQNRN